MPNYYPYQPYTYGTGWQYGTYPNLYQNMSSSPTSNNNSQYMINVDGEMAARAWQMPSNLAPNTVIPLWDLDGEHVYFKSIDSYGRMNPLRKGKIVFEDENQNLIQGQSGAPPLETQNFVTKEDLEQLKQEIKEMFRSNQNGNRNSNRSENR